MEATGPFAVAGHKTNNEVHFDDTVDNLFLAIRLRMERRAEVQLDTG